MSDLISRQDAIDAVNSLTYPSSLMDVKRKLIELPSADRPTGEWQDEHGKPMRWTSFAGYCSNCGKWSEYLTDYCGNCGAKMGDDNHDAD